MLDDLPGFRIYYDAQLEALRGPKADPHKVSQEEWMRREEEHVARSNRARKLQDEVAAALRSTDVATLLDAIEGDEITPAQRPYAFLVVGLVRKKDARLLPADRERFARMLENKMRHAYPRDGSVFWFLRDIDPERATVALLTALDRVTPVDLTRQEAEVLTRDLGNIPERGLPALQRLAALGGEIGALATKGVERLGHFAPGRVEEVAARWRRTRERDELDWLYNHVITRYREGTVPIDQLRALLGEPTESLAPDMFIWTTDEAHPIALIVGVDNRRSIVSYKLK